MKKVQYLSVNLLGQKLENSKPQASIQPLKKFQKTLFTRSGQSHINARHQFLDVQQNQHPFTNRPQT
jgi:hypothetical protein